MINLGIVGLGNWGRRHLNSANASGRFRIVRAVSKEPEMVAELAAEHEVILTTEFEDVIADPTIDAVTLATPHTLHTQQIISAAEAGKHVFTEKPFALTKTDAEAAVTACDKAGVALGLGHDNRQYPALQAIKRHIEDGSLGTVVHFETNISHDATKQRFEKGVIGDPAEEQRALGRATNEYVPTRSWRLALPEAPSGPLIHLGVHRIDAYIYLGGEIDWVMAQNPRQILPTEYGDTGSVLLQFKSGVTGYIAAAIVTPMNSRLQVFGSEGWIEATGPRDFGEYTRSSLRDLCYTPADGEPENTAYDYVDSVEINLGTFADEVEGKGNFAIPRDEMIHNAAVTEAIIKSIKSGEKVHVS